MFLGAAFAGQINQRIAQVLDLFRTREAGDVLGGQFFVETIAAQDELVLCPQLEDLHVQM